MRPRILAIGELLWDYLPSGPRAGGAPANMAIHAHGLGADARLVTRVGNDKAGRELGWWLSGHLNADTVQLDHAWPTGTVAVALTGDGQPGYVIQKRVAWDRIALDTPALEAARGARALCFGSLAQRSPVSRSTVRALVRATPPDALRLFDVNLRAPHDSREVVAESLGLASAVKVNESELKRLAGWFGLRGPVHDQVAELARRFALELVALTRGAGGSLLHADGFWSEHPGLPVKLVDAVGAGDAFTAALTMGWLAGWPLDTINHWANSLGAFVCSQPGATPPLPTSISWAFADALHAQPVS